MWWWCLIEFSSFIKCHYYWLKLTIFSSSGIEIENLLNCVIKLYFIMFDIFFDTIWLSVIEFDRFWSSLIKLNYFELKLFFWLNWRIVSWIWPSLIEIDYFYLNLPWFVYLIWIFWIELDHYELKVTILNWMWLFLLNFLPLLAEFEYCCFLVIELYYF